MNLAPPPSFSAAAEGGVLATSAGGEVASLAPAEELATFTAWATAIFYLAEADRNPAIQTYFDAYHYIATSLSVGYANIFPVTQVGKMVGAVVMMVGPALSSRALEGPSASDDAAGSKPQSDALIAKLDEILVELRKRGE
ncbi:MAG TPA: potassium channel family protein [Polyangiaceae bacterium]|nr:potassium channel family protein [Polyangiaceae bacterium]